MESRQLLFYAQRLQAISQAGLAYPSSVYDQERYEEIREISVGLLGELTEEPFVISQDYSPEPWRAQLWKP